MISNRKVSELCDRHCIHISSFLFLTCYIKRIQTCVAQMTYALNNAPMADRIPNPVTQRRIKDLAADHRRITTNSSIINWNPYILQNSADSTGKLFSFLQIYAHSSDNPNMLRAVLYTYAVDWWCICLSECPNYMLYMCRSCHRDDGIIQVWYILIICALAILITYYLIIIICICNYN